MLDTTVRTATVSMIQNYLKSPPFTSRVLEFTPDVAKWILETMNPDNRGQKRSKIKDYRDAMSTQRWNLTGDTIKFGSDHLLRDGQNRLRACAESGMNFVTHVVFGIDPDFFATMDIGRNRNGGDVFTIAKVPNAHAVAAATRWVILFDTEQVKGRPPIPNDVLLAEYQNNYPDIGDSFSMGNKLYQSTQAPNGPVSLFMALHYLFKRATGRDRADVFFLGLTGGLPATDPREHLRQKLADLATLSNNRVHDVVRAALFVIAWNAWVEGCKFAAPGKKDTEKADPKMRWDTSMPFPEIAGA